MTDEAQPTTANRPRTWADVAHLAVCLFGAAAVILALSQCSFKVKFRDPPRVITNGE
jgi:hypothetical protein